MPEYLLTIVTVTLNCANTVRRTLSSVAAIKGRGIEYIVIDGVSTDGTLDIIRSFGTLVDLLISEPDTGIYNAMNKGARLAKGKYILFINGDDALVPDGFHEVLRVLACNQEQIVSATTFVGGMHKPSEQLIARPWQLPFFNSIPHPSTFVARKLLLQWPFREDLRIASDYDFFLRAYLSGLKFRVLPFVTALHTRGGASGNVTRSSEELERVRRNRLGWRYPILTALVNMYRLSKSLLDGRRE